ncbi:Acyl-CoA dehydrogenase [compost metagenome]
MKISFSEQDECFRQEVADWLAANLCGEFEPLRFRGGPGDEHMFPEARKAWERKLASGGWTCVGWASEHGGRGLSITQQVIFNEEYARAGGPGRMGHIGEGLAGPTIAAFGTVEQQQRFLPGIVNGTSFWCQGYSEPGAGSDANSIKTRAARDGDDFVINGSKHFISHAGHADFAIVFAVTDTYEHNGRKRNAVTALLVDRGTPGMTIRRGPKCVSNRGYHTYELFFDDCRVPASKVLGEVGKGWEVANAWLTAGRVMVAANCVGQAQRALDLSLQWAADRKQFGQAIGSYQGVSFKLADMATQIRAAEMLTLHTAWKMDQGNMTDGEAGMAKLFASEVLGKVADEAVQIFGGMGLMDEGPVERIWRNARIERIWEGTSEIQRHIIARELLRPLLR